MKSLFLSPTMPHIREFTSYKQGYLLQAIPSGLPEFNECGYRADTFREKEGTKVVSIGCSDVFGYCLPREQRFSDLFCQGVAEHTGQKAINWNLGLPGKSNDYIARNLLQAAEVLKPDIVLVCFTRIIRREWFNELGVCVDYIPGNTNCGVLVRSSFEVQSNYNANLLNFYMNYKLIEKTFPNTPLYISLSLNTRGQFVGKEDIESLIDPKKYVGYFESVDHADPYHPGPRSNRILADKLLDRHFKGG